MKQSELTLDELFKIKQRDLTSRQEEEVNNLSSFFEFCKSHNIDQNSVGSIYSVNGKKAMLTMVSVDFQQLKFQPLNHNDDLAGYGRAGDRLRLTSFDKVKHVITKI